MSFHDISWAFPKPGDPDPYNLINADNIHPDPKGHELTADLIAQAWELPSRRIIEATPPAAEPAPPTWSALTSDGFSGDGAMAARNSDVALGGTTQAWAESVANTSATSGGKMVFGANLVAGLTYLTTAASKVRVSAKIDGNLANSYYLIVKRTNLVSGSANQLRAHINGLSVKLSKVITGTATDLSSSHTFALGDTVTVEYNEATNSHKLEINGATVATATDATVTGANAYVGVGYSSGGGALSLDAFLVETAP